MEHKINRRTTHLSLFSRSRNDNLNIAAEPRPDPSETDGANLASNVSWGTNQDFTPQTACQGTAPETPKRPRRDERVKICFTAEELTEVKQKATEAGLDCSKYIRAKLKTLKVIPAPVVDVAALTEETRRVGWHIDDVLARARAPGFIDAPELHRALDEVSAVCRKTSAAFTTNERRDG